MEMSKRLTKVQQQLVTDNLGLAMDIAYVKSSNLHRLIEPEELCSIATEALIVAAHRYNPEHISQARFSTYAVYTMRNAIGKALRELRRNTGFSRGYTLVSMDANDEKYERFFGQVELDVDMDYSLLKNEINRLLNGLPYDMRVAIELSAKGETQAEVAKELGCSRQNVCKLLKRARTRLAEDLKKIGVNTRYVRSQQESE